jgi:hypothetical protein
VVDDVHHQTQEAIHEPLPRFGLVMEAVVEQLAIEFGKCHWAYL